jgi:uncharacterized protein YndB with AHSA1/START domain
MNPTDTGIEYELSRMYSASPDALFNALTNAVVLKRIWGVQEINVDAHVGGQATVLTLRMGNWSLRRSVMRTNGPGKQGSRFSPTSFSELHSRYLRALR